FALSKSTGEWILYLDADERLDESSAKLMLRLSENDSEIGFYCTVKSYDSEVQRNNTIRYVRFFRNHPQARFEGKVHEQITPSLEKLNYKFIHSDILIHHIGYDISKEGKKQKAKRNLSLLLDDYAASKNDYSLFQIAQSYHILENYSESKKFFLQLTASQKISKQLKAEAHCYLSQIFFNEFRNSDADKHIRTAISLNSTQPFYHFLNSKINLRERKFDLAKQNLLKAINCVKNASVISLNNLQQVNISLNELLYYGLHLSYQTSDNQLKSFIISELSKNDEKEVVNLILLLESNSLNQNLDIYLRLVNNFNLPLIVYLLSKSKNLLIKEHIMNELHKNFPENKDIIKQFAITKDNLNQTQTAIKLIEDNFEKLDLDPSAMLYLAMFYLKISDEKSANKILNLIEEKFANYTDLISKVKKIKTQLTVNVSA
ncbi:hypothetical protein, partial [Ignavibacterium sp.]|uniref:hypothetical protein n=1 Tax=Ignavibacterium sp. TaxID=2651167 RepID=UPI00307E95BE